MVSAAARNGGSQFGMTLLLSRKRSVSPDSREGWLEAEPPAYDDVAAPALPSHSGLGSPWVG
jgi:hypothetical protein